MDDVKDSNPAPAGEHETLAVSPAANGAAPELDGSVDALVANLRAAKKQFEALLEGTETSDGKASEVSDKGGRSAA